MLTGCLRCLKLVIISGPIPIHDLSDCQCINRCGARQVYESPCRLSVVLWIVNQSRPGLSVTVHPKKFSKCVKIVKRHVDGLCKYEIYKHVRQAHSAVSARRCRKNLREGHQDLRASQHKSTNVWEERTYKFPGQYCNTYSSSSESYEALPCENIQLLAGSPQRSFLDSLGANKSCSLTWSVHAADLLHDPQASFHDKGASPAAEGNQFSPVVCIQALRALAFSP